MKRRKTARRQLIADLLFKWELREAREVPMKPAEEQRQDKKVYTCTSYVSSFVWTSC